MSAASELEMLTYYEERASEYEEVYLGKGPAIPGYARRLFALARTPLAVSRLTVADIDERISACREEQILYRLSVTTGGGIARSDQRSVPRNCHAPCEIRMLDADRRMWHPFIM